MGIEEIKIGYTIRMRTFIDVTEDGFKKLQMELTEWEAKREGAVKELSIARAMGDLSENAAYTAARRKLNGVDYQVRRLKRVLSQARVVAKPVDTIGLGSVVTYSIDGTICTYEIVGSVESDIINGKLSQFSPVGKALVGKKLGDKINARTPSGVKAIEIHSVQ